VHGVIVVGIVVGILGALAAGRLLEHLFDGTRPTDLSIFAIMIPILLAAALFASFIPAPSRKPGGPNERVTPGIARHRILPVLSARKLRKFS
jgi:hypothetical protein